VVVGFFLEGRLMRISKDDWHQEFCDQQCVRGYCSDHRLIFQFCQSAQKSFEHDEWGRYLVIAGDNECPTCKHDYENKELIRMMEISQRIRENQKGAA